MKRQAFLCALTALMFAAPAATSAQQSSPTVTFAQRLADVHHEKLEVNGVKYHYVTGGDGDTVVLLHGWAETWYAWRHVIPTLIAAHYSIVAPDLRGLGDTGKPATGYEKTVVAADIKALADALKLGAVHIVGHDLGGMVAYAYAAQYPDATASLTIIDVPLPGIPPWKDIEASPRTWHFRFFGVADLPEMLIAGRERAFLSWFYNNEAVNPAGIDDETLDVYARAYATPGALRGGFEYYRAFAKDAQENTELAKRKLTMPVLGVGGAGSFGALLGEHLSHVANDVRAVSIPGSGHWVANEQPQLLSKALLDFLGQLPSQKRAQRQ
jgi:pimeloyl-ACP methyl ester carboxylesterase